MSDDAVLCTMVNPKRSRRDLLARQREEISHFVSISQEPDAHHVRGWLNKETAHAVPGNKLAPSPQCVMTERSRRVREPKWCRWSP
jgi:hypothetical protein